MSTLSKVTFAFHAGLSQYFLFTGSIDNPAEINNVTPSVEEGIIAAYLTKPGVLKAPDGSEFLLELSLLPAFREAKQRMLDEAQAKITEANALVQPAPVEDIAWMADLTNADKEHLKRIVAARRNGQRVSYSYSVPFEFRVKLGPAPAKKKKAKTTRTELLDELTVGYTTPTAEAYEGAKMGPWLTDEVSQVPQAGPPAERVPVVVVELRSPVMHYTVARSEWDAWAEASTSKTADWLEKSTRAFCFVNNILMSNVASVDLDQTRTQEALDDLAVLQTAALK